MCPFFGGSIKVFIVHVPYLLGVKSLDGVTDGIEGYYLGKNASSYQMLKGRDDLAVNWQSIAEPLDAASKDLRSGFIENIGALSEYNQSLDWWSSELASKNPAMSPIFFNLCLLQAASDLVQDTRASLFFAVENPFVLSALAREYDCCTVIGDIPRHCNFPRARRALHVAYQLGNYAFHRFKTRRDLQNISKKLEMPRVKTNSASKKKTVLFFTWLSDRSFNEEGDFIDPYWGRLIEHIAKQNINVIVVPHIHPFFTTETMLHRLERSKTQYLFIEEYLTYSAMITCALRVVGYKPEIRLLVDSPNDLLGAHADAVWREESERVSMYINQVYYYFIKELARRGTAPDLVLHTHEGHSWEKVLTYAIREFMPGTRIHAYNNLTFTSMLPSMFPSTREFAFMPMPDKWITMGERFAKKLVRNSYPASSVVCAAALRHDYLWRVKKRMTRDPVAENACVVVATSALIEDSIELLSKALIAFGGVSGYKVFVKLHPLVDEETVFNALGSLWPQPNVELSEQSIFSLLEGAQALLYTFTSTCFDAIVRGVPPIFVKSEHGLNMNKLDDEPRCHWVANDPESIRSEVEKVVGIGEDEWRSWYAYAYDVSRSYLTPVDECKLTVFTQ
jgi:surface carbohydrate biosynthesis protein (TIGR04326 family)